MIRMLMFHSPPLLLIAFFCMRELPRIEIPPLPRRSFALRWLPAATEQTQAERRPDAPTLAETPRATNRPHLTGAPTDARQPDEHSARVDRHRKGGAHRAVR